MNCFAKYQDIDKVVCRDGRIVPCNYLKRSDFSFQSGLCAGLHYAFISYSQGVSYARSYGLRTGINALLDFRLNYNQLQIPQLQLHSYSQLIPEIIGKFEQYEKANKFPKETASRLFNGLRKVALEKDEGLPLLSDFKFTRNSERYVTEPLTDKGYDQLTTLLKEEVDLIYQKIKFREQVEATKSYTRDEITGLLQQNKNRTINTIDCACKPDDIRALKTLISANFPFCLSLEDFIDWWHFGDKGLSESFHKSSAAEIVFRTYKKASNLVHPVELLSKYYPTSKDQTVLALFICIQTGWNKETVMSISPDNFEQILSGALNDDYVLLTAEKEKSQSTNKPFFAPKTFLAPSDKINKYSAYNLITLAKKLSDPLSALPRENFVLSDLHYAKLFLFIRQNTPFVSQRSSTLDKPVGRFTSIGSRSAWSAAIRVLLKKKPIADIRGKITNAKQLTPKLRPTWIKFVRDKHNSPLSLIALQQGHSNIETTDIHYDNSGLANQKRKERLTFELSAILELIRKRRFKGLVHKTRAKKSAAKNLRLFNLPNLDRILWACQNPYSPDFPDFKDLVSDRKKCTELSKCLFCSQIRIFEDSLPFLLSREASIRLLMNENAELPSGASEELEIIQYILSEWNDEKALKSAARYFRRHEPLLPADMNLLKIIFED